VRTDGEKEQANYLKSLTPREELSVFLTTRADSLFFLRRFEEARRAYAEAVKLSPRNFPARYWLARTEEVVRNARLLAEVDRMIDRQQRRRQVGMPQVVHPRERANSYANPPQRRPSSHGVNR